MDNRVFNVNGKGTETLTQVLELAFNQLGKNTRAKGFVFDQKKGLILLWYLPEKVFGSEQHNKIQKFPAPLTANGVAPIVMEWLSSEEAGQVQLSDWDLNIEHDGHNSLGWRVYVEDWGHIGNYNGTIAAITPAFMWHGK